jgi:DNA polymerase III psi subunit
MQDIWPQMSQFNQSRGGPTVRIDKIVDHKDIPSPLPNGKAAVVTYDVTRTNKDGVSKQYRGMQRVQMAQTGNGMWNFTMTGFTAPVDTFDHDRKLMFAIIKSEKVNEQVVMQKMNEQQQQSMAMIKQQGEVENAQLNANHQAFMQQQQQQFDTHEAQMAQNDAARDARNQQFSDYENQRSRNKDNQVEQILGYREVYDTQTGLSANVDLNDVNGVVNALNQAALDPNRFVQIPLRDLQDPR